MISFLFTISFIIHLVTIYIVLILYRKLQAREEIVTSDIVELLEVYVEDLKNENEKLAQMINQTDTNQSPRPEEPKTFKPLVDTIYNEEELSEEKQIQLDTRNSEKEQVNNTVIAPLGVKDQTIDQVETSLPAKILALADQGLSIDEIAKQLNCGKTEAELILKFHGRM